MHFKTIEKMFSSVGGGPLQRMMTEMKKRGQSARLTPILSPEQWRDLFRKGTAGRLAARALTFGAYPLMTLAEAIKLSLKAKPLEKPILVVSTNPFFLPHFLVAAKPLHRCGVVSLMYDMYPDAFEAAGVDNKWLSKIMTAANKWMIRHSDAVVYLGDEMRASSEKRYGKNPITWIIPNGADRTEFDKAAVRENALDKDFQAWCQDRCLFSYVGNMGLMHDVETLEKAVPKFLADLNDDEKSHVGIVIAATGPGDARLRESWKNIGECVKFIGPQKDDAWANLLIETDIALATLTNEAHATSAPSKIYSAVTATCIPLVVAPDNSDLASLVRKCGEVIHPGDVEGLVRTMKMMFWAVEENEDAFEDYVTRTNKVAEENDITQVCSLWQGCFDEIADRLPAPWSTLLYHSIKRGFDLTAAAAGLAVIWPLLAATAVGVKKHLGSPILFRQMRPGIDGKPFELLKFRSMANAPEGTDAAHDGERLSEFGKKIRALSLDELPTLLNVLKGDMSLVGPRPLLMSYLDRYNSEQMKRQWAKPGITGWAQINGRNALSWDEKFKHDVWYVENASLLVDIRILILTVLTVLSRSGIQHEGSATMPEFMGNEV